MVPPRVIFKMIKDYACDRVIIIISMVTILQTTEPMYQRSRDRQDPGSDRQTAQLGSLISEPSLQSTTRCPTWHIFHFPCD